MGLLRDIGMLFSIRTSGRFMQEADNCNSLKALAGHLGLGFRVQVG